MSGYPDEEPEVEESAAVEDWLLYEDIHANGHCRRCGIAGHPEEKCPTITPLLLRNDD